MTENYCDKDLISLKNMPVYRIVSMEDRTFLFRYLIQKGRGKKIVVVGSSLFAEFADRDLARAVRDRLNALASEVWKEPLPQKRGSRAFKRKALSDEEMASLTVKPRWWSNLHPLLPLQAIVYKMPYGVVAVCEHEGIKYAGMLYPQQCDLSNR